MFKPKNKLTFYMKSGNNFTINGVIDWTIKTNGEELQEISLTQGNKFFGKTKRLIVKSLCLSQVEAIIEHK